MAARHHLPARRRLRHSDLINFMSYDFISFLRLHLKDSIGEESVYIVVCVRSVVRTYVLL